MFHTNQNYIRNNKTRQDNIRHIKKENRRIHELFNFVSKLIARIRISIGIWRPEIKFVFKLFLFRFLIVVFLVSLNLFFISCFDYKFSIAF